MGLCQAQFGRPPCADCEERPLRLAPGVVDGPFRCQRTAAVWVRKASDGLRTVVAYLMGPHP
ncbi:MAG: hypothetical protein A2Z93_06230 [Curvibacter sp. GWA2_64_110]|nr:MAG: hypothetical protein A2Z93_06230 [Curvibacter sp. GWA2_64_110]HCY15603.1 hypothetical protein [Curvibacter sp.]